jgi:aminoglycoside 2'-N-acetyltransferase I
VSSGAVTRVQVAHTADLSLAVLDAGRALLYAVFDDMTDEDWDHALGGMHALAWDDDVLIGHASVVQRRLLHRGRALRTGYVEGVAVRAEHRRHGIGGALMAELERIIRGAYELGALGSSDEGLAFYLARGWQRWRGPTFALTPTGVTRTAEEDGYILVWPASPSLALDAELTCDWREGDAW